ncbi:hypothetical protein ACHAXT_004088 [Thalassiosira profunda]
MLAHRATSPSLRSNFEAALSSPARSPQRESFTIEMSDVLLPASDLESELFGAPQDSGATVVSASSSEDVEPAARKPRTRKSRKASAVIVGDAATAITTQPVPEFLCHLFTMLREPSYAGLISWQVPTEDEPERIGAGIAGIGKIVVHQPEALQEDVLGKYYRHSKYASFQRQLNYFGFKKRLHNGKKGKLSPCSYIHELLSEDVASLFSLKRRPPSRKRASQDMDDAASLSSLEEPLPSTETTRSGRVSKKRRLSTKKSDKKKGKKERRGRGQHGKQQIVVSSVPLQVQAEEYAAPAHTGSAPSYVRRVSDSSAAPTPRPAYKAKLPVAQPTLIEMLSTSLPPSDVLFDDDVDSLVDSIVDDDAPAYVTDNGRYHHAFDSSLVELAMLY